MNSIILLLLAVLAVIMAFVPRWREKFHWGRGADSYRATRSGCLLLAAALATMAGGLAAAHLGLLEQRTGFFVLIAGFVLFLVVGLLDRPRCSAGLPRPAEAERRRRQARGRGRDARATRTRDE